MAELTEIDEQLSIDTAAFALHSMHLAVCISAFFFNILLLYLLTQFTVFHHHMKIIVINLTVAIIAAVFYLLIRSTLGLWQIYEKSQMTTNQYRKSIEMDQSECAFSESVPRTLCVLFFVFPMLLVIERAYATKKFWEYENENVRGLIGIVCGVLWLPTIFDLISFVFHFSIPNSLEFCQFSMLHQTFLQRNIWFFIISGFTLIFAILFKILEKENKHNEIDYVTNHYSTLSIRFQIRENVKTCRFAVSLNLLFSISFLVFYTFDENNDNEKNYSNDDREAHEKAANRREFLFLIFPMFALIYAIHFITSQSQLFDKAKRTLKMLASIQNFAEQEKMLP